MIHSSCIFDTVYFAPISAVKLHRAAFVERDEVGARGQRGFDALRLKSHELRGAFAASAVLGADFGQLQGAVARQAAGVVVKALLHPVGHSRADGDNAQLHARLSARPARRRGRAVVARVLPAGSASGWSAA